MSTAAEGVVEGGEDGRGEDGVFTSENGEQPEKNCQRETATVKRRRRHIRIALRTETRFERQTRCPDVAEQRSEQERGLNDDVLRRRPGDGDRGIGIDDEQQRADEAPRGRAREKPAEPPDENRRDAVHEYAEGVKTDGIAAAQDQKDELHADDEERPEIVPLDIFGLPPGVQKIGGGDVERAHQIGERPAVFVQAPLMPEIVQHLAVEKREAVGGERDEDDQDEAVEDVSAHQCSDRQYRRKSD